jgi:HD-like signal output (HDOD) protein
MSVSVIVPELAAPPDPRCVQQAIGRLQALPAFYPTIQKALGLLDNPLATNLHLQQVLSSDQAIAARVLKLANSAYFGAGSAVGTLSLAVALVSRERLHTLLQRFLAEELLHMLSDHKPAAGPIRKMSLATAAAARSLAERLLRQDAERFLIAGLLHNVGELLLLSQFREAYEDMLRRAEHEPRPEAERGAFGVETCQAGRWLLEAWKLPLFFCDVAEHCADPWAAPCPATPRADLLLVHTARRLAEALAAQHRAEQVPAAFPPRLLAALEIDPDFLADVYTRLPGELQRLQHVAL